MVWGLFLKMVIADRIAILVDNVFNNYYLYWGTELIFATIGFTIQIYCDFASYSTIAIGASRIMGFDLMENFNTPYLASSIKDFWRRWHISLSTWFRDYLYIPLGGNRCGAFRKNINVMITFLISGLWHGADWSYVIWGGLHGLYQVVGDVISKPKKKVISHLNVNTECESWKILEIVFTFILVAFAWIFFRADSLQDAFVIISRIISKPSPWVLFNGGLYGLGLSRYEMNIFICSTMVLLFIDIIKYRKNKSIDQFLFGQNTWFRWLFIVLMILATFIYGEYGPSFDAKQFIYFQF